MRVDVGVGRGGSMRGASTGTTTDRWVPDHTDTPPVPPKTSISVSTGPKRVEQVEGPSQGSPKLAKGPSKGAPPPDDPPPNTRLPD